MVDTVIVNDHYLQKMAVAAIKRQVLVRPRWASTVTLLSKLYLLLIEE